MATGEVVFTDTLVVDSTYPGSSSSHLVDGDFTNEWSSNTPTGGWAGYDLGAAAVVTRVRVAPRPDDASGARYDLRIVGGQVQSATNGSFTAGLATWATLAAFPYSPRYQFAELAVSGASAARYWRFYDPTADSYCNLSEVEFVGNPAPGTAYRPCAPSISPWGGRFPGVSSVQATLSSLTTSASIYYTTDGSTPSDTNGTLASGPVPVSLTAGSVTTLKAVAYDATCATPLSRVETAYFCGYGYKPRDDWHDDRGILIEAHGGGVLDNTSRDGWYYWYGAFANRPNATGTSDLANNNGVWCYKSLDLLNWVFVGQLLDNTASSWSYIERPHVLYNAANSNYVLWAHGSNSHDSTDRACIATSASPSSGWTWQSATYNPDSAGFKDFNLFQDGTDAYLIWTDGTQAATRICALASDYQAIAGTSTVITQMANREAPILFKRGGTYFWIGSTSNYYDSTSTFDEKWSYTTASDPLSGWAAAASLFASDPVGGSFNGQGSFVVRLPSNGFVYCSDSWDKTALYSSRQVWLPLAFPTATSLAISTPASWDASVFQDAGSASITLAAPSLVSAGTSPITGDLSANLDSITISATGTVADTGTVNIILPAPGLSSTGTETIVGTASITLDAPSLSAAATAPITGDLAATLDSPSLMATGSQLVESAGDLAITLAAPTLAATATAPIVGSLAATLSAPTLSAAGTALAVGDLSAIMAVPVLSSTAVAAISGASAPTLPLPTFSSTGTVAVAGQLSATLAAPTLFSRGGKGSGAAYYRRHILSRRG